MENAGLAAEEFFHEKLLVALPKGHALAKKRRLTLDDLNHEANAQTKFGRDFVAAWNKVMNADRFDVA